MAWPGLLTFCAIREVGFRVPIPVGVLRNLPVWAVSARGPECPRYTSWTVTALLLRITPRWNPTHRKVRDEWGTLSWCGRASVVKLGGL